ncbi:hypothetical protein V495_02206 [Pseudogymnoascus sp. VKM F-4514 (FW-929)]|nr:hypothetical protein V495_02206 [Pseudogymnoascus sp. VKM F-4514 (FW-929)]KFY57188.1 hypothetical protein V497_05696 [Pseudogymnoascus sp. VKM F-4516 (FW-969)]
MRWPSVIESSSVKPYPEWDIPRTIRPKSSQGSLSNQCSAAGPSLLDDLLQTTSSDPSGSVPNIPAKRPWEGGDASPSSQSAGPRSGESEPHSHFRHLSGPTHTVRRASDTTGQQVGWDTSAQTQGWATKPEPARYGAGFDDNYVAERRQPVESRDASLGRSDNVIPFPPQPAWTKYRRESSGSSFQTNFDPPSSSNETMYPGSQETRRSSYTLAADELGAVNPRRGSSSAKVSLFEQNCEKCNSFRPRIKEFISMIQKFETSLGPFGPYQEIHEHCLRQGTVHDEVPNFPEIHRILNLLNEVNDLAKNVVQLGPVYLVKAKEGHQHKPLDNIKLEPPTLERYFSSESDDASKRRRLGPIDQREGRSGDARRHSSASPSSSDRLPPIYFSGTSHHPPEGSGFKLPSMNPPPTPGRHITSPTQRSRNSPPSYNMSSPDSSTFPPTSSSKPPQPPHQPLSPSVSSTYSSGATSGAVPPAVATHTATLQHEVSVKAYALQTLQQEHDKLLAALSRSQTRSRALEEKQVVADNEVNVLSEDRNRLMDRIAELEKEVSEVSEARDEYRNAGVKEGKQYVEIVRMASQLELMAAEERKIMAADLAEKERQLSQRAELGAVAGGSVTQQPASRNSDETVRQLNAKCANYEAALKEIRRKRRRIDDIAAELGLAGTDISQSLNAVLGDEPQESTQEST